MRFWISLLILVGYTLIRLSVKSLFGDFFYTTFGEAIGNAVALGGITWLTILYFRKKGITFFPTQKLSPSEVLLGVSIIFYLYLVFAFIGEFEDILRNGTVSYFKDKYIFGWSLRMKNFFLGILVVAPIFEELFVHGLLLQGFRAKYKDGISIALVTIIFMSLHFSPSERNFLITDKLAIGLSSALTGYFVIRASNIWLGIFLHFFWNLLSYSFPLITSLMGINLKDPSTFYLYASSLTLFGTVMLMKNLIKLKLL